MEDLILFFFFIVDLDHLAPLGDLNYDDGQNNDFSEHHIGSVDFEQEPIHSDEPRVLLSPEYADGAHNYNMHHVDKN
jgi:hypothetical protein